jgi:hypothetical protein
LTGLVLLDLVTLLATLNAYHPAPGHSNGGTVTSLGQVLGWVAVIVMTGLAVIIATSTLARSIRQRRVRRTYRQLLKDEPELR